MISTCTSMILEMCLFLGAAVAAQPEAHTALRPGSVYREYALHNGGDRDWRITNPQAADSGARKYLPNPVWRLSIDSLAGAVRAEVMLDRWSGHLGTTSPRIRFNGNPWLDIPPPALGAPNARPEDYYFQDNPVIPVPLEYLQQGMNTIEGTCGHVKQGGWGQWGLYSLVVRVYFDPGKTPHARGKIIEPTNGATIEENPKIVIQSEEGKAERVDVFAWYFGYDENGDGRWLDWHGGWFQPFRGEPAEWSGHVGTTTKSPYRVTWDTRWVPDQPPGQIALVARIRDTSGHWYVTEKVTGLTLRRTSVSVQVYPVEKLPSRFGVRAGETKSCVIRLPDGFTPQNVIEAALHYRTWHGWDKHHAPFRLNDYEHPHQGKNHHYDYRLLSLPPSALRPKENVFTIHSATDHHMLEVLWPGPAISVRYRQ